MLAVVERYYPAFLELERRLSELILLAMVDHPPLREHIDRAEQLIYERKP